ncbi:MAG: DUF2958 domain-containing protein [Candidatus Melainabacteria bacterium]|nr:DUF2958 domain-containing protein [Candidatus Melainabacteria bacterium]
MKKERLSVSENCFLNERDRKSLPPLYSQENNRNPKALVHYFDVFSKWHWYAIEFDGKDLFFGLVLGLEKELGYFTLSDFIELNKTSKKAYIVKDSKFKPQSIKEISRKWQNRDS